MRETKCYFILLYPSRREVGKNIMHALPINASESKKEITNITFDNFLPHTLNKISHESKKTQ